jgi:hypothetical protein
MDQPALIHLSVYPIITTSIRDEEAFSCHINFNIFGAKWMDLNTSYLLTEKYVFFNSNFGSQRSHSFEHSYRLHYYKKNTTERSKENVVNYRVVNLF